MRGKTSSKTKTHDHLIKASCSIDIKMCHCAEEAFVKIAIKLRTTPLERLGLGAKLTTREIRNKNYRHPTWFCGPCL
jgi:hypothetical protein